MSEKQIKLLLNTDKCWGEDKMHFQCMNCDHTKMVMGRFAECFREMVIQAKKEYLKILMERYYDA